MCQIPSINTAARARFATIREASFGVSGPRLFNSLPAELRGHTGEVESFKRKLDKFLSTIPDCPPLPGYHLAAASNSIIDQMQAAALNQ